MYFKECKLQNFRNYKELSVSFDPHLNLILGKNAQGKTNLLESLFIMSLGRSFRTSKDTDMICFGEKFARAVSCVVSDDEENETSIEINYSDEGKGIKVNDIKLTRSIDLLENVYIVVFFPDDLRIIKEGPENRRKFLDRELCQMKPVYFSDLANYKKILKERNTLLKNRCNDQNLFAVYDEALADYGIRIADERRRFTQRINSISSEIHHIISDHQENLVISYETDIADKGSSEERKNLFAEKLKKGFEHDLYLGHTCYGPHKDDLKIEVNGIDMRQFGSQGQQRTAALSMKLAETGLIKEETGCKPVLLLDDVLSELDRTRQRFLVESMKDVQMFISATEIDEELMKLLPAGKTFYVTNGKLNA